MSAAGEIRFISAQQTWPLRQKVLRSHLRVNECGVPDDATPTTFHLGLFYNQKLIGIASFLLESSPYLNAGLPYRLRGMATDEFYRGQGFGGQLLRFGLHLLKEKGCDLLWCNARLHAFPFYQSMGFQFYGELFNIKDSGPHKVMYKVIIPR